MRELCPLDSSFKLSPHLPCTTVPNFKETERVSFSQLTVPSADYCLYHPMAKRLPILRFNLKQGTVQEIQGSETKCCEKGNILEAFL
ncbi:hypothetical protein CDAR_540291 [Caerostris darwini]|uniref:Uncharacterized protein n=1 Tax=Caerostris darwini TaxID=1538125 RepID=A0AAV4WRJ2_9ARAC|nr:hypothetical protein CDAR_540291 [Caerostris darwini]